MPIRVFTTPIPVLTMPVRRSRCADLHAHDAPIQAFTIDRRATGADPATRHAG